MKALKTGIITLCLMMGTGYIMQPKYYVSAVALFRNEARFLPEWIEHHRKLGIEHFYLFNHLSTDHYLEQLQPYINQGVVELFDWPFEGHDQKSWNMIQCRAYDTIVKRHKYSTWWLAIIDTDEFIALKKPLSLPKFLERYEPFGGVAINWQTFGTSHVQKIPEGHRIVDYLTHRAPTDHPDHRFVKSIVQPKKVKRISQPHFCHYYAPFYHVTENFTRFAPRSMTPSVSIEQIRIHHYTYRDEEFFRTEKQRRHMVWHPDRASGYTYPSYDEVEDTSLSGAP